MENYCLQKIHAWPLMVKFQIIGFLIGGLGSVFILLANEYLSPNEFQMIPNLRDFLWFLVIRPTWIILKFFDFGWLMFTDRQFLSANQLCLIAGVNSVLCCILGTVASPLTSRMKRAKVS